MLENTLLFKSIPRNYWPDLHVVIKVLGAESFPYGVVIPSMAGKRPAWAVGVRGRVWLDKSLLYAFWWKGTPQGEAFWSALYHGVLDA